MASSGKIVDLRALLAERFPSLPITLNGSLTTDVPGFDETTGGGLHKGAITELISPHVSSGSASFIAALIQAAHRNRYFVALIDGNDSFDPQALGNNLLRHLLWLRCHTTIQAMKSADLLLRDGNFPLVIIDLVLNPAREIRKVPQTSWYRLQRLVEATSTAFLVLTRFNTVSSAQLKVVLNNIWTLQTSHSQNPASCLHFRVTRAHGRSELLRNILAG